ncbi:BDH_1b_G0025700.mRNA.1.CDS.1 [Saccharomyces cerevisiae]|nr:BDH_1b_G0025700.mRNA.1.CDS.1 [Saccharomyces cerevisiae]CAI7088255.1 BDH_1b_G0025700.mRNA.1.CDS.1 [Saccharomyces cerevisiae]
MSTCIAAQANLWKGKLRPGDVLGTFQEELICKLLLEEPAKYPGCSGSRRISDNISDLKAQIAANNKGIQLIAKLMNENGHEAIVKYMKAIQDNASENI